MSIQEMINEGVRRAYANPDNRCALGAGRPGRRPQEHQGQHPGRGHFEIVEGHHVEVICAAKGGGSEAKSKFAMLNPSDDLVDWVLKKIPKWAPAGVRRASSASASAARRKRPCCWPKESIMAPVDIHELKAKAAGAKNRAEELRLELWKGQRLGVGAQGLGGLTTVLDVKVLDYPCHAANLPVALVPNCAATRHATSTSTAPARPGSSRRSWKTGRPSPGRRTSSRHRVDLEHPDQGRGRRLETGPETAAQRQDADRPRRRAQAHRRHAGQGRKLPVDFTNRVIYYVGPVDPVRDEVVGPAGPTTATRMDKFTRMMLEQTGL